MAFLPLLAGCATVFNGRSQIVPVDSEPRGLSVDVPAAMAGSPTPGKTPFFAKLRPGPEQVFELEMSNPGPRDPEAHSPLFGRSTLHCHVRWIGSVGANMALAGLFLSNPWTSVAVLAGGQGLDLATGAAYDCSDGVRIVPDAAEEPHLHPEYCRRLLLVPPLEVDGHLSKHFAALVRKLYLRGDTSCDTFVDYDQGEEALNYLNITNLNHPRLSRIDRKHWYRLGYDLGATHLLVAEPRVQDRDLVVRLRIVDLVSLQNERELDLVLPNGAREAETGPRTRRAFAYSLAFLPNAVSYSYDIVNLENKRLGEDGSLSQLSMHDQSSRGLSYLTGLSFENVEHPDGFAAWDVGAGVAPSLSLLFWDARYQYTDTSAAQPNIDYVLHLTMVTPTAMATITGHTPIGAFSLGLGIGPAWVSAHDEQGAHHQAVLVAVKRELDYTAFLTSQTFFRLGVEGLALQGHGFQSPYFDFRGYSDVYAGIGWFLPGVRQRVMQVLDR